MADSATLRKTLRNFLLMHGILKTESKPGADPVYEMYAAYSEPVAKIAPHRVLAIDRGEREGALKVSFEADLERCRKTIVRDFVKENTLARILCATPLSTDFPALSSLLWNVRSAVRLLKKLRNKPSAYSESTCSSF